MSIDPGTPGGFPTRRPRRLRGSEALRRMVRETTLDVGDLIYPAFVCHGEGIRREIPAMPGIAQLSVDRLVEEAAGAASEGIPAVLLFGLPRAKDAVGSEAYDDDGIVQRATRALKEAVPGVLVVADLCLCEYTDHGHCGVLRGDTVDNDQTLPLLARTALAQARAGADIIAPSDMMDGRVGVIRRGLDENGFSATPIMAYSAKYASAFYGPFREAADSAPQVGDRRGYQMDPANAREAVEEMTLDLAEGADILMVKPALLYLDVIREARQRFTQPIAAYNVSGEYSMLKAAAQNGWLDERRAVFEALTAIKRAGADLIITYHARDVARWLAKG
ncbi:MAG TPA: porphobilinogen synthase [Chloroflexota bacterium]|nr:porphobilinogen synthase [Chloroflexota bacterium]